MPKSRYNTCKLLIAIVLVSTSWSDASGTTWYAGDPSIASVQTAINSASTGDTVVVPSGTATWTTGLVVTKAITLQGAGIGSTIIKNAITTSGSSPLLLVTSVASQNTRITGIEFQDAGATAQSNGVIILVGADWNNSTIRFDNCKLNQLNGIDIMTHNVIGVIDHCTFAFSGVAVMVKNSTWGNVGNYGDNSWASPSGFGTSQFLFIETNTFNGSANSDAMDAVDGARYVFRYNTCVNGDAGGHGTESTQRARGMRAIEVYNNTFSTPPGYYLATIRSGVAICHDNTLSGWPGATSVPTWKLSCYRLFQPFSPWGGADGTNQWDINQSGGPFYSGTVSSSGSLTVTVSGTPWTTNQWHGYSIKKLSGSSSGAQFSFILSNTSSTITFSADLGFSLPNLSFSPGDTFAIYKVTQALDQPGVSGGSLISGATPSPPSGWNDQAVEPCYQWNNTYTGPGGSGSINFIANLNSSVVANHNYYNNTAMPGYTPYTYPHPLVTGGITAPSNLRVVQ